MFGYNEAMLSSEGFVIRMILYDRNGEIVEELEFPNALDSVCGIFGGAPAPVSTGLVDGMAVFGQMSNQPLEVWGIGTAFHRIQPLLDLHGNKMRVTIPDGVSYIIYAEPKVRPSDPVEPINVVVRTVTGSSIQAQLYWSLEGDTTNEVFYSDGTRNIDSPVRLGRVSEVRVGSQYYCRMLFELPSSRKSIVYFQRVYYGLPIRIVFSPPFDLAYSAFCDISLPLFYHLVVDIPRS